MSDTKSDGLPMNYFKELMLVLAIISGFTAIGDDNKSAGIIFAASGILYLLVAVAEHMNYL